MNLATDKLRRLDDPELSRDEHTLLRCRFAQELEEVGSYEAARQALSPLWERVGQRPQLEGLERVTAAEVLLRVGALSGWIGSARQIEGAQEWAKDLISESATLFESLNELEKVAETRIELALCYWREGAYDEARVTLRDALARLENSGEEPKLRAVLNLAVIEGAAQRLNDALRLLTEARSAFESSRNQALKGKFHNVLATVLKNLGAAEHRADYTDEALVQYAAASFYLEQAGHTAYRAAVENNLALLYFNLGQHAQAHEHLDYARQLFEALKDYTHIAQVDETRARVLIELGRYAEAEKVARHSAQTLERGSELALIAEALTTQGIALARLDRHEESWRALRRASTLAQRAGDQEGAGRAELTIIEELSEHLPLKQMRAIYESADELLSSSQHTETIARLRACARHVLRANRDDAVPLAAQKFVYASPQTAALLRRAHNVAVTNHPVLITGETGTGKEILAQLVHEWSGRAGLFVTVNCAALTDQLLDSELFGYERGSLEGARQGADGAARKASGGTLFLDEIAELSANNQTRLLRLIEHGEIHPIGAPQPEQLDVRVVATTSRNLKDEMARGRFREDLFYRLQAFSLEIPPLRERTKDIEALAREFLAEANARLEKQVTLTEEALEAMRRLPLKGNARELRGLIERAVLDAGEGATLGAESLEMIARRSNHNSPADFAVFSESISLEAEVLRYEGSLIRRALEKAGGSVTRAARLLGVTHQGLAFILQGRHKDLLPVRTPVRKRRRSIITKGLR